MNARGYEAETERLLGRPISREEMSIEEILAMHEFENPYDDLNDLPERGR